MIPISNFYTGQNAGVVIPDTPKIDRSIKNYYDKQFEISKMELADAHRRQKQFLDFTDITPIESISEANRARQVAALNEFETFNKEQYNKYNGKLPTPALMDIQQRKRKLEGLQRDIKANESLYFQDLQRRNQSTDKFDIDTFQEAERILQTTGKWVGGLVPAPKDLDEIAFNTISKEMGDLPLTQVDYARKEGETVITSSDQEYVADPKLVKKAYQNQLLYDDGALLSATREFQALPPDKQKYWFDAADKNNNGLDAQEKQNAILEYSYQDRVDRGLFNTKKKIASGVKPSAGSFNIVFKNGAYWDGNKWTYKPMKDGLEFNQNYLTEGWTVKTDKLTAPVGVELPDDVTVIPTKVTSEEVQFIVDPKDPKYKTIKKWDIDEGGQRVEKYLSVSSPERKEGRAQKVVPAKKNEKGQSLYWSWTYPSKIAVKGSFDDYAETVANNYKTTEAQLIQDLNKISKPATVKKGVKYIIPNVGSFTAEELKTTGKWTDADIAKLKQE